ncbi:hypothetical protein [Paenibacillus lautus]|uniref:hypothetical protein n=1 Tax=Paenibacillus lautus TaxID=1401 RepID=UPI001C7DF26F|nr:hypothetical protein [Paenibacillus lautus]MBX4146061.1 hypothetical protein [Paenibacillus lautus]
MYKLRGCVQAMRMHTHPRLCLQKNSNGAGGIVLEKRRWSPLPPDFNDIYRDSREIWGQQRSEEQTACGVMRYHADFGISESTPN